MQRKIFWLASVFVLSAMLVLSLEHVQAQITGFIPVFVDEAGTEDASVIFQTPLTPAGNIGIGTTNPQFPLDVNGTINTSVNGGSIQLFNETPNLGVCNAVRDLQLRTGNIPVVHIQNATQFVGIGTDNPSGKVTIRVPNEGDFALRFLVGFPPQGPNSFLDVTPRFTGSQFQTVLDTVNNRDLILLTGTQNVGIGTTSPAAKLHVIGNFVATGSKSALVDTASYGKRQLYAVESPENWFEDFGKAKLINGQAVVKLDPVFYETVNTENDYHVFLTPKGECEGLYVANQTAHSFEVKELRKGKSTVAFDYRIVAKRKGYEHARLAEVKDTKESTAEVPGLDRLFYFKSDRYATEKSGVLFRRP